MPDTLRQTEIFARDLPEVLALPEIQQFECGTDEWDVEVSDWIKNRGTDTIATDFAKGCRVWLYSNQGAELVGFGSLGKTNWRWPTPKSEWVSVSIIPMMGIRSMFHGRPKGPGETRYSDQILCHLKSEAAKDSATHRLLSLLVHIGNAKGKAVYDRHGFQVMTKQWINRENGRVYDRRFLDLAALPAERQSTPAGPAQSPPSSPVTS